MSRHRKPAYDAAPAQASDTVPTPASRTFGSVVVRVLTSLPLMIGCWAVAGVSLLLLGHGGPAFKVVDAVLLACALGTFTVGCAIGSMRPGGKGITVTGNGFSFSLRPPLDDTPEA
jgi:hypothetical protein